MAIRLLEQLPSHPIVTIPGVVKLLETTKPTAGKAVQVLEELGVLTETSGKQRDRTFAYKAYLEKLRSTRDGDGTLLDSMLILYGSGISDGNKHSYIDVPVVLAGGAAGRLKGGGRHVRYPSGTPLANLQLTLLHMLGVPLEKFGGGKTPTATLPDLA